jgi:quercetin dioxygenase-like cupin family protein
MTSPVSRVPLLDQAITPGVRVDHAVVQRVTMAPGVAAGPHRHNSPVLGSVERGSAVLLVEGGAEVLLRAGDAFFEPGDTTILRFDATEEGCVFLAAYLLPAGQEPELELLD